MNQNKNFNDSSVSSSESWQNFEEELLIGWKRKVDGTEREHFMSPSGDRFKGRFRVIKYLKEKDVTGEIVAAMRKIFGKCGKLLTSKSSEVSNDFKEMKEERDTQSQPKRRGRPKKLVGTAAKKRLCRDGNTRLRNP